MAFVRSQSSTLNQTYQQQAGLANGEWVDNGTAQQSHQPFKLPQGMKFFSWGEKPGMVAFNILPFMVRAKQSAAFMYHVEIHEFPNPSGQGRGHRYICPHVLNKKCVTCDYKEANDTGSNYDEIKAYIPKQRTIFLVQPVVNGVPQNEIQFLECAKQQKGNAAFPQKLMAAATLMANGQGIVPFADPDQGKVVVVQTAEDSFNGHKFLVPGAVMFQDRTAPLSDEILAKIPDAIEDLFNVSDKDDADMEVLMNGGDIGDRPALAPAPQPQYQAPQPQYQAPQPAMQYQAPAPQQPTFQVPPTQEQYAAAQGMMPQQPAPQPQYQAPQMPMSQMPEGPLTMADFGRDPYQAPARSFPQETVAQPAPQPAPISNGFVRSRV